MLPTVHSGSENIAAIDSVNVFHLTNSFAERTANNC